MRLSHGTKELADMIYGDIHDKSNLFISIQFLFTSILIRSFQVSLLFIISIGISIFVGINVNMYYFLNFKRSLVFFFKLA